MLIIEVRHETKEMLGELNNGVVPEVEEEGSYFLYHGKDTPPEIISFKDAYAEGFLNHQDRNIITFPIKWMR